MNQISKAVLGPVRCALGSRKITNDQLASEFEGWTAEKIEQKTGIFCRRVVIDGECASDLAVQAAERLFAAGIDRTTIDFLIFCTQSPDYLLPTTACLLQHRLELSTTCGAFDMNLGCSGYVYALGMAKGLVESGQATRVLLLTADTYSRMIAPTERSLRTIFGDGASASLIEVSHSSSNEPRSQIGPFSYGTDGRGADNLIVRSGGFREPHSSEMLFMNGPEVFNFTLRVVPSLIQSVLSKADLSVNDIDLFVFHQANAYMLRHLVQKLDLPSEKCPIYMSDTGNIVSSTIPLVLEKIATEAGLTPGTTILLAGFGVGYSWGATILTVELPIV